MAERPWSNADRELVAHTLHGVLMPEGERKWPPEPDEVPAYAAEIRRWASAVLDALTAAGWRPPPPEPDGVHWRTGTSVGRTVYNPYGDLVGLMDSPELAAEFVVAMNGDADA